MGIGVGPDMLWPRQRGQILRTVFQQATAGLLVEAGQSLIPEVVIAANQADCQLRVPVSDIRGETRGVAKRTLP